MRLWSHSSDPSPRRLLDTDTSILCPTHGGHRLKYCPDLKPHLDRQRAAEAQSRRDLAARFRGLRRCLTCDTYYDPTKDDHHHRTEEEE